MIGPRRFLRPHVAFSASAEAHGSETGIAAMRTEQFRLLMLPHMDAAYTYARYLARDAHRAEDIVQDAFLRAFRGFDTWRGDSARAWLFAIVRNCFLASTTDIDWQVARDGVNEASLNEPIEPIEPRDPETIAVEQDEAAMLRQTIENLPQPFRETLILRELEELSYKDIAQLTSVPIGTVMSRLARARSMLAELLLGETRTGAGTEARS